MATVNVSARKTGKRVCPARERRHDAGPMPLLICDSLLTQVLPFDVTEIRQPRPRTALCSRRPRLSAAPEPETPRRKTADPLIPQPRLRHSQSGGEVSI